jgi:hypothetical protein
VEDETADHREGGQWIFYVVDADQLPDNKTISLGVLIKHAQPCHLDELKAVVAEKRGRKAAF